MKIPALGFVAFVWFFCARVFAQETVPLISATDPSAGWTFNNGQEFPGATGSLATDAEAKREGRASLKLVGDFTKGGTYVDAGRKIDGVDVRELSRCGSMTRADRRIKSTSRRSAGRTGSAWCCRWSDFLRSAVRRMR